MGSAKPHRGLAAPNVLYHADTGKASNGGEYREAFACWSWQMHDRDLEPITNVLEEGDQIMAEVTSVA